MIRVRFATLMCAAIFVAAVHSATAAEFFVSPNGTREGDGGRARPWDLATALAQPRAVKPGDTIWLLGGTYKGGFTSELKGTPGLPITVRQAAGERATIDFVSEEKRQLAFTVGGQWAIFRDFEVTCSNPKRATQLTGSWPEDINRGGITCGGSHIQFINLIIHDTSGAFGFWSNGEGGEIYGCIMYNNGWRGPDRGHGHAIYAQNTSGTKRLIDNIMFNQFGYGIHVYGSSRASLKGFHVEGNVSFNNGSLAGPGERTPNIHVGGGSPCERIAVVGNYTWSDPVATNRFGYGPVNKDLALQDNYFCGLTEIDQWERIALSGNTLVGRPTILRLTMPMSLRLHGNDMPKDARLVDYEWRKNRLFSIGDAGLAFTLRQGEFGGPIGWGEWHDKVALDGGSKFTQGAPAKTEVFVRPNRYEPGRAHVVVFNWEKKDAIEADLNGVLKSGQPFKIVSAQDYFGEPVVEGRYDGEPVRIPMKPVKPAQPVGMPDYEMPVTGPAFGVFVVLGAS